MLHNMKEQRIWTGSGRLSLLQAEDFLEQLVKNLPKAGHILLVPPDITRCYSFGGVITAILYRKLSPYSEVHIMPALGTHRAMGRGEQIQFLGRIFRKKPFCIMIGGGTR